MSVLFLFCICNVIHIVFTQALMQTDTVTQLIDSHLWNTGTLAEYELKYYVGEFYKGELIGSGVNYQFLHDAYTTASYDVDKYMFIESYIIDPLDDPFSLNWDDDGMVSGNNMVFSSEDLSLKTFLMVKYIKDSLYHKFILYNTSTIRFDVSINQCLGTTVQLNIRSSLLNAAPIVEASVTFSLIGYDCQTIVSDLTPNINMNKAFCGVTNSVEFYFIIITGLILTNENSQMFNMVCYENYQTIVETAYIENIDAPITVTQDVTDFIIPNMAFVNVTNNESISEAFLGDTVRILIDIPLMYRTNFDIDVKTCYLDDILIISNRVSVLNKLVHDPFKISQGIIYIDMKLFRKFLSFQNERLMNLECTLDTCLNSCVISRRRRRRAIETNDINLNYSFPDKIYHTAIIKQKRKI